MGLLTFSEQQNIKPLSNYSDKLFTQLENEASQYYTVKLFGYEMGQDIIANPEDYENLLKGGVFSYNNTNYNFRGYKYVLAYYIYLDYLKQISLKDSYTGIVRKNHTHARDAGVGDIKILENLAKRMLEVELYLLNKYTVITYNRRLWSDGTNNSIFEGLKIV
jgi:hypothetical protein